MIDDINYPDWLIRQRGVRYQSADWKALRSRGWYGRQRLIRKFADHLEQQGEPVTLSSIRAMLVFVDRGYSLKADQIGFALAARYKSGQIVRYSHGKQVTAGGVQYSSVRQAAIALGVSPQTVLNRINSSKGIWDDWCALEERA